MITDRKANVGVIDGLIVRNGKRKIARVRLVCTVPKTPVKLSMAGA